MNYKPFFSNNAWPLSGRREARPLEDLVFYNGGWMVFIFNLKTREVGSLMWSKDPKTSIDDNDGWTDEVLLKNASQLAGGDSNVLHFLQQEGFHLATGDEVEEICEYLEKQRQAAKAKRAESKKKELLLALNRPGRDLVKCRPVDVPKPRRIEAMRWTWRSIDAWGLVEVVGFIDGKWGMEIDRGLIPFINSELEKFGYEVYEA